MFLYFAYGSNMLTERLAARCPSARALGPARAQGYSLVCDKISKDGSGKFGIVASSELGLPGVIFEIARSEQAELDRVEDAIGTDPGYRRVDNFEVSRPGGVRERLTTYVPLEEKRCADLLPYAWYRALVHAGALQHGLDADHAAAIAALEVQPDPQPDHPRRRDALEALRAAGYVHLVTETA